MDTIGEKIRELRKNSNLTQKDLAKLSGIAEITIRKYENNERNPKKEQIEKIAKVLKVTPFEILGFDYLNNIITCDYANIGKKIKQIREFENMTQQELAEKINKTEK